MNDQTVTRGPTTGLGGFENLVLPNRWKLEKLLGVGGQAHVWLAFDRHLGELVALKIFNPDLSPEALARLRREVRLGRELRHPHLVRVYELIEVGDRLGLAMEWLPGGSLKQRLASGPLPVEDVVKLAGEVLSALQFLHAQGIVHRDVKPSNLLLDAQGHVHLADLGLAKSLSGEPGLTRTTVTVGTLHYMSPEQLRGRELGPATDLYSLGVTIFELLTGGVPFTAQNEAELVLLQLKGRSPDPRRTRPDCPRWLARFIMRLLEPSPRDRFPDAGAALQAFSKQRAVHSPRALRENLFKAAVASVVGVVGFLGWQEAARAGRAFSQASVSWEGQELLARDRNGRFLWRYRCGSPISQVEQVDLDGDGRKETVVATRPHDTSARRDIKRAASEVLIFTATGRIRSRLAPDSGFNLTRSSFSPGTLEPWFRCADLNRDGKLEVIVSAHHRQLGWNSLHIFWPELQSWQPVLTHIGWLTHVLPVPDAQVPRLRFLANNGPLLELEVVGELQLKSPGTLLSEPQTPFLGTTLFSGAFSWYTPISQLPPVGFSAGMGLLLRPDGSSFLSGVARRLAVDRWGNPIPGPNAGKNLSAMRLRLLTLLSHPPDFSSDPDPAAVRRFFTRLRNEHEPLLVETAYRAIVPFFEARGLVHAGDHRGAKELVRGAWQETRYEALGVRLAHLEALDGNFEVAAALLREVMASNTTPMARFYGPRLLSRIAIEKRDWNLLNLVLQHPASSFDRSPVAARARIWWDQPLEEDCESPPYDTEPDAEAIAFVARWRMGRVAPEDLEKAEEARKRNPDAPLAGKVARAAVLLGLNRAEEALADLEYGLAEAGAAARDDFEVAQTLQLARAIYAKALLASGRRPAALKLARELKASLRPGLLPAILVEEVLTGRPRKPLAASNVAGTRSLHKRSTGIQ